MKDDTSTDAGTATAPSDGTGDVPRLYTVWLCDLNPITSTAPIPVEVGMGHRHRARRDMFIVEAVSEDDAIRTARVAAARERAAVRRAR